jgi:hypothetical protein
MSSATNKLVSTLSEINQDSLHSYSNYTSETSSSGFFSNLTWQTWLIIILILAFLGINVFYYLEMGTKNIVDIFDPILKLFGYQTLETTKQTINASATGTKAGVDIVANTTTGAINAIENNAKKINNTSTDAKPVAGQRSTNSPAVTNAETIQDQLKMENQINELEDLQQQNLQKALQDASRSNDVKPDDSLSRIQASNGSGKAGWCFIGEDRGFRTCSQIGQNDQCMSGDIFPSHEICMNPNLRP